MQPELDRAAWLPAKVRERLDQVSWVLGHLDDLASDLSAIHGIRDMSELSGPALCKLAYRMTGYQSVIRERVALLQSEGSGSPQPAPSGMREAPPSGERRQMVPATKTALQADPVMSGLISFGSPKSA